MTVRNLQVKQMIEDGKHTAAGSWANLLLFAVCIAMITVLWACRSSANQEMGEGHHETGHEEH